MKRRSMQILSAVLAILMLTTAFTSMPISAGAATLYAEAAGSGERFTAQPQTTTGYPNAIVSFTVNFPLYKYYDVYLDGSFQTTRLVSDSSLRSFETSLAPSDKNYTIRAWWGSGENQYIESAPFKVSNGCAFTTQPQNATGYPNGTVSFTVNFPLYKYYDVYLDGTFQTTRWISDSTLKSFETSLAPSDKNYTIRAFWGSGDGQYIESAPFKVNNGCAFTVQPQNAVTSGAATIDFSVNFPLYKFYDVYLNGSFHKTVWVSDADLRSFQTSLSAANGTYTIRAYWGSKDNQYIEIDPFHVGNTATVTFNLNGRGSNAPAPQSVIYGETATEPDYAPVLTGYYLDGWFTDAACTEPYDFSTPVTQDIILYARWSPRTFTLSFTANGGTGTQQSITAKYGDTITGLYAGWTQLKYPVDVTVVSGEGVASANREEAAMGSVVSVSTTPADGWELEKITVNCDGVTETLSSYYFTMGAGDAQVSVFFKEKCTHAAMIHYEEIPRNCYADGRSEYWYCPDCGKLFWDEDGAYEVSNVDWLTLPAEHRFEEGEPYCLNDCGTKNPYYHSDILGDANADGLVDISDATAIQRHAAGIEEILYSPDEADVDGDGEITVVDATLLQSYLAGFSVDYSVGKSFYDE